MMMLYIIAFLNDYIIWVWCAVLKMSTKTKEEKEEEKKQQKIKKTKIN